MTKTVQLKTKSKSKSTASSASSKNTFSPNEKVKMVGSKIVKTEKKKGPKIEELNTTYTVSQNGGTVHSHSTETESKEKFVKDIRRETEISSKENIVSSKTGTERAETRREIGKFLNDIDDEFKATYGEISSSAEIASQRHDVYPVNGHEHVTNGSYETSYSQNEVRDGGTITQTSQQQSAQESRTSNSYSSSSKKSQSKSVKTDDSKVKLVAGKITKSGRKKESPIDIEKIQNGEKNTEFISTTVSDSFNTRNSNETASVEESLVQKEIYDIVQSMDVNDAFNQSTSYSDNLINNYVDHPPRDAVNSYNYVVDKSVNENFDSFNTYVVDESVVNTTNVEIETQYIIPPETSFYYKDDSSYDTTSRYTTDKQFYSNNIKDSTNFMDVSYVENVDKNFQDSHAYSNAYEDVQSYSNHYSDVQVNDTIDTSKYSSNYVSDFDYQNIDTVDRVDRVNTYSNNLINETVTSRQDVFYDERILQEHSIRDEKTVDKKKTRTKDFSSKIVKEQCICEICTCGWVFLWYLIFLEIFTPSTKRF